MSSQFIPLSGDQIKAIILHKVEQALDNDQNFRQHLTYPVLDVQFSLVLNAYPNEPSEIRVQTAHRILNPIEPPVVSGSLKDAPARPTEPSSMEVSQKIDIRAGGPGAGPDSKAPNEVLEECGLPVLKPTLTKVGNVGMIFDQVAQTKAAKGSRAAK